MADSLLLDYNEDAEHEETMIMRKINEEAWKGESSIHAL